MYRYLHVSPLRTSFAQPNFKCISRFEADCATRHPRDPMHKSRCCLLRSTALRPPAQHAVLARRAACVAFVTTLPGALSTVPRQLTSPASGLPVPKVK